VEAVPSGLVKSSLSSNTTDTGKHNHVIRFLDAQIPGKEVLKVGGGEPPTIMRDFFPP